MKLQFSDVEQFRFNGKSYLLGFDVYKTFVSYRVHRIGDSSVKLRGRLSLGYLKRMGLSLFDYLKLNRFSEL